MFLFLLTPTTVGPNRLPSVCCPVYWAIVLLIDLPPAFFGALPSFYFRLFITYATTGDSQHIFWGSARIIIGTVRMPASIGVTCVWVLLHIALLVSALHQLHKSLWG
jgi:hypothetical protein